MRNVLDLTKAMADGTRLRVLMALADGDLCVCQIVELLQLAPSTVSKHMSILRQARLVESRKDGRWVHYHLADAHAPAAARDAIRWLRRHLSGAAEIAEDAEKLKAIVKLDPEELCKRLNGS